MRRQAAGWRVSSPGASARRAGQGPAGSGAWHCRPRLSRLNGYDNTTHGDDDAPKSCNSNPNPRLDSNPRYMTQSLGVVRSHYINSFLQMRAWSTTLIST